MRRIVCSATYIALCLALPHGQASAQVLGPAVSVGKALASGDFNNDGYSDVAVAATGQTVGTSGNTGAVQVHYGSSTGLSSSQTWSELTPGLVSPVQGAKGFGTQLTVGDFNADGFDDLAIYAGNSVRVVRGSSQGLTVTGNQRWDQDSPSIEGVKRTGGGFGRVMVTGRFNNDQYDDIAISDSSPLADGPGEVNVIHGSPSGLNATYVPDQLWRQDSPYIGGVAVNGEKFGAALAVGDFDTNGRQDLAVGAPGEAVGTVQGAGTVTVLYSGANGLGASTRAHQLVTEQTLGTAPSTNAAFGKALSGGNFVKDLTDETVAVLVVGRAKAPATFVQLLGVRGSGLSVTNVARFSAGADGAGYDVLAGYLDREVGHDLVMSGKDTAPVASAGRLAVAFNAVAGPGGGVRRSVTLDSFGVPHDSKAGDGFGERIATGDFNGDGYRDLIVSAPGVTDPSFTGSGVFLLFPGVYNPLFFLSFGQSFHEPSCLYRANLDDCMDRDGDGVPAGVERLAGSSDANPDTDSDGIPDGIEVNPTPIQDVSGAWAAQTRSNPVKPTLYTLLLHPSDVTGLNATTLKSELNKHFAGSSALQVITWNKPLSGTSATTLASSCIQTIASETNAPNAQQGWLTPAQLTNYVGTASTDEISIIAPYARVGRICSAGDSSPTVKGMVQYKGGWQFMVQMRSLAASPSADFVARWHRALGSLAAHELGHALGLGHGGGSDDDCSPLYPSVMNHGYDFQPDASGRCSQIGFSSGVLSAHAPAKQLEIVAGNGSTTGTSEYDVLQGAVTNTGAPVNAAHLGFLACFGKGDLGGANDSDPLQTVALKPCPDAGSATYCANWDRDEFEGAEESLDVASEYVSVDRRYDASSLLQTRTLGGRGAGFVSGCAVSDLNPNARNPPPAPLLPLQDHDDFALILELLRTTAAHAGCGIDSCTTPVTEPNSATLLDTLRGLWP